MRYSTNLYTNTQHIIYMEVTIVSQIQCKCTEEPRHQCALKLVIRMHGIVTLYIMDLNCALVMVTNGVFIGSARL